MAVKHLSKKKNSSTKHRKHVSTRKRTMSKSKRGGGGENIARDKQVTLTKRRLATQKRGIHNKEQPINFNTNNGRQHGFAGQQIENDAPTLPPRIYTSKVNSPPPLPRRNPNPVTGESKPEEGDYASVKKFTHPKPATHTNSSDFENYD